MRTMNEPSGAITRLDFAALGMPTSRGAATSLPWDQVAEREGFRTPGAISSNVPAHRPASRQRGARWELPRE